MCSDHERHYRADIGSSQGPMPVAVVLNLSIRMAKNVTWSRRKIIQCPQVCADTCGAVLSSFPQSLHRHHVRHVLSIHKDIGQRSAIHIVAVGNDADRSIVQ